MFWLLIEKPREKKTKRRCLLGCWVFWLVCWLLFFLADFICKQPNSLLLLKGKLTEHWGHRKRVLKVVLELGTAFYHVFDQNTPNSSSNPTLPRNAAYIMPSREIFLSGFSWAALVGLQPKPYCRLKADISFTSRDAGSWHAKLKHPALLLGAQYPSGWSCQPAPKNWEGMLQQIHSCNK